MGTCSSRATSAFSCDPGMAKVIPTPNGGSNVDFDDFEFDCDCSGLSNVRILRMDFRVSSAFNGPVANIPHPPFCIVCFV